MMGIPIHIPLILKDVASLWPPYHDPDRSKLNRGNKRLIKASTWVIVRASPYFPYLWLHQTQVRKWNPYTLLLNHSRESLRMCSPMIYPWGSLHWDELSTKLTFYQVLLCLINRLIGVILVSQRSYNDRFKSCLIVGILGRVWVHVCFQPFWYLRKMGLGVCVWILGP